ncbi:MAG: phage holin family protein [Verrucomicrobia bacterium]|nr:phage holin family protein [Verrucomicrobiota bacterium]
MSAPQRFPEFKVLLKQWVIISAGVVLASLLSEGIRFESASSLVLAVLLISALNVFLKPVLVLMGLPFIVMTFGFGILLINALIFALAGYLVPGFQVLGFWSALWGAFIVSLTTLMVSIFLARPRVVINVSRPKANKAMGGAKEYRGKIDDVIDV